MLGYDTAINSTEYIIIAALQFTLSICIAIYVSILFLYKLYHINKVTMEHTNDQMDDKNADFLSIITKTSIATIISMTTTIIMIIFLFASTFGQTVGLWLMYIIMILLDTLTNFFVIVITNNFAKDYYIKLCGCLDIRCRKYCLSLHGNKESIKLSSTAKTPNIVVNHT